VAAHGAGDESAANAGTRRVAEVAARFAGADEWSAAFNRGTPTYAEVLDRLTADEVVVVPLLTSDGYFHNSVLPRELGRNRRFDAVTLTTTAPLGLHPALRDYCARQVRAAALQFAVPASDATLVVVGHGTTRDPRSAAATRALATALYQRLGWTAARAAFLDDAPRLEELPATLATRYAVILPFMLGGGEHAATDIPQRLGAAVPADACLPADVAVDGRRFVLLAPLGEHPVVPRLVGELAMRARLGMQGAVA
jgi:sirohydrochlorin cobaltochelatase